MSLRLRLIGLVAIALVISLLLAGGIACLHASRSVATEMRSALLLGRRAVENAAQGIEASRDPRAELERLVSLFEGNRHLRVSLAGDPEIIIGPEVEEGPFGEVPAWFVRLIDVPGIADRLPIAIGGRPYATVLLETDPRNETLEVWNDFNNSLIALALFSGQTILLIYFFFGRALRPLHRLGAALERIGPGNYATRVGGRLAPELSRLRDSFNRMAVRLTAADADNRRLTEQMLTLQEAERGEIARDLHDEIGPYLFAISLDTANISRLLNEGRTEEAAEHLSLVAEAVRHMQRELRNVVHRLRPVGLAEFALHEAIANMAGFWRRRHPEVDFRVTVAPDCRGFGELVDTTIYRLTQECLSNALRHGEPTAIAIRLSRGARKPGAPDRVVLEIADDGPGRVDASPAGFGLRGMAERVRAIGGALTVSSGSCGGVTVTATLPCHPSDEPVCAAFRSGER